MTSALIDELTSIRDKRGELKPEIVVEEASDPDHPLHSRFEWDDSIAGHRFRLEQASRLLRVVKVEVPGAPRDLRAFVAVKGVDSHTADYVPTAEAFEDDFTRKLVLQNMEREWRALKRRYEHMSEFAAMIAGDLKAG